MANAVSFSYATFIARYPEFRACSEELLGQYFVEAGLYFRNDGTSPVTLDAQQLLIMNMFTAHIAALYAQSQGQAAPGQAQDANSPVGRIASATQGSVTVSTELQTSPAALGMQQWLAQTKYGLSAWSAIKPYILSRYVPGSLQPGGLGPQPFPYPGRVLP